MARRPAGGIGARVGPGSARCRAGGFQLEVEAGWPNPARLNKQESHAPGMTFLHFDKPQDSKRKAQSLFLKLSSFAFSA
jgi:hypothetical protein